MKLKMGPGVLVAAAFIGPGTVTVCSMAGVQYGYLLLWALLLSVVATVVLQEMAARLGIITQKGLANAIKEEIGVRWIKMLVLGLILSAIVIGNAAYEGGNIGGASLGLEAIFGPEYQSFYPWIVGIFAFLLLLLGNYRVLEKVLVSLVVIMSISFLLTAIITGPDISAIIQGLFIPKTPDGSILNIIALVGTTVVPYNLFLHTSLVSEKWKSQENLKEARRDTVISIALGGMVSMSIVVAAAAIPSSQITNVMDMTKGLEPLYGESAKYFMGIGLFAAGVTSAITAPLAAAYVANSCFGWNTTMDNIRFKLVWMTILLVGVLFMSVGIKPLEIIKFAQVTNGMLLPIISIFLLWIVNRKTVMQEYQNTQFQNVMGINIIILSAILGAKSILTVFGLF
ncbi:Nramp family divalent metal transporter [Arenibacter troitsensis]|uniref:NRAMP (Natural resistance-associated macrophage protein) metal ion transporters n=1 Tax=Arenibacter troitsensis TaxID=188872 RepID=A0A1X7J877_9FLAO|nr:Nramp family divalent metal transporter [Arenibacter troitsensis]SMG23694.1 NRAMP (natural resistance-associated macrophage protein) metal ion transporters [Arenibacter troitsensis]